MFYTIVILNCFCLWFILALVLLYVAIWVYIHIINMLLYVVEHWVDCGYNLLSKAKLVWSFLGGHGFSVTKSFSDMQIDKLLFFINNRVYIQYVIDYDLTFLFIQTNSNQISFFGLSSILFNLIIPCSNRFQF